MSSNTEVWIFVGIILVPMIFMVIPLGYMPVVFEANADQYPTTTGIIIEHKIQNITDDGNTDHDIMVVLSYEVDNTNYISNEIRVDRIGNFTLAIQTMERDYPLFSAISIAYSPENPEIAFNPNTYQSDQSLIITGIILSMIGFLFVFSFFAYTGYLRLGYLALISLFTNIYTDNNASKLQEVVSKLNISFSTPTQDLLIGDPKNSRLQNLFEWTRTRYGQLYGPIFLVVILPAMFIYTNYPDRFSTFLLLLDLQVMIEIQILMTDTLYFPELYFIFLSGFYATSPKSSIELLDGDKHIIVKIIEIIVIPVVTIFLSPAYLILYLVITMFLLVPISLPISLILWSIVSPMSDFMGWNIRYSQVFNTTAVLTLILATVTYIQIDRSSTGLPLKILNLQKLPIHG